MGVLTDAEIWKRINNGQLDIDPPLGPANYTSNEISVQAGSLDLHIGRIFPVPATTTAASEAKDHLTGHQLKPGETAVVFTQERIRLASNLLAFGFPPARVSVKGLLMTNPGIVDPGYDGHLSFTVINMGREPRNLKQGERIVRLIVVDCEAPATGNFRARNPRYVVETPPMAPRENLIALSHDFVNVEARATEVAKSQVKEAELNIKYRQIWIPIVAAVIAAVVNFVNAPSQKEFDTLKERVIKLEARPQR